MEIVKPTKAEIVSKFSCGINCAQCVLAQCASELGYDEEELQNMTAAFGGGMGRGDTCGAVSGALIAIGLALGEDDEDGYVEVKQTAAAFQAAFIKRHGTTICRDLLGYDFSKPGERDAAANSGILSELCPQLVCSAIEILKELL